MRQSLGWTLQVGMLEPPTELLQSGKVACPFLSS